MSTDENGREETQPDDQRPHAWYDDDFCSGGDLLVGTGTTQTSCPVCGEMMDVDEDGHLFKHRPRIPEGTREVPNPPQ